MHKITSDAMYIPIKKRKTLEKGTLEDTHLYLIQPKI